MRIGDLHEEITIEQHSVTLDSFGAAVETWSPLATVRASVLPQRYTSGIEAVTQALGRESVATSYTVTIYYRNDVTELHRVIWGGKTLDIRRVIDPDGRRRWLELLCEVAP